MLTLLLTLLNTFLLIILFFWLANKDCPQCQQEKPLSRIFKNKCPSCERSHHE